MGHVVVNCCLLKYNNIHVLLINQENIRIKLFIKIISL